MTVRQFDRTEATGRMGRGFSATDRCQGTQPATPPFAERAYLLGEEREKLPKDMGLSPCMLR